MQVEIVAHNPLGSVSGIGRYARELSHRLSNHIPTRVVTPISPPFASRLTFLHQLPLGLRDHQPGSLVHFTQIMGCAQMLWHPVQPAIVSVHDLGVLVCEEDDLLFNRFDRAILSLQLRGLRRMDYYVVSSDQTRQGLVDLLAVPPERIHKVQLGVDMTHYHPIEGARQLLAELYSLNQSGETFDVLYVGSELPRKNLHRLLKSLWMLKEEGYPIRLIKVGGAGGQQWRERLMGEVHRLGLEEEVVIIGQVPEDHLPLFYNACDVAICPSLLEGGFSWPTMEAMACGTAAIASTASHVPEHVQDAVLIVDPLNTDEIADAIRLCFKEPLLRDSLATKAQLAIASFTWESGIDQMLQVYAQVCADFKEKCHA